MLSHTIASKQSNKDEGQSNGRKTSSLRPPEEILKCPRCDSPNTKFCYYNNYSLTQPRHFCKACRRYWTKGGALRSVPIGGSCRKNKNTTSCNSSRFFVGESSSKGSSINIGGTKFHGLSTLDFQLGGLNFPPRVSTTNQLFTSSYGDTSSKHSYVDFAPLGFNFPFASSHSMIKKGDDHHHQQEQHQQLQNQSGLGLASFHEMSTSNHVHLNTDLASSIESLSSVNQDLHWRLQQQRLAMLFENDLDHDQKHKKEVVLDQPQEAQKLQPILFQNLETPKPLQLSMDGDSRKDTGTGIGLATEWFFDNNYAQASINSTTPTGNINNWNGIQFRSFT